MEQFIKDLLRSKAHNSHFLERYIKFIENATPTLGYSESHHICPKAIDLFIEFASFKKNPWNKIRLSARQHFIAHWMLRKAYGGSQNYAFVAMCTQKTKHQLGRNFKIPSSVYVRAKTELAEMYRLKYKHTAIYSTPAGNRRLPTNHPDVLSGEYTSTSLGRSFSPRSNSSKKKTATSLRSSLLDKFPTTVYNLYFLDIKISIGMGKTDTAIVSYLDQGWSLRMTPECKSKMSTKGNLERFNKNLTKLVRRSDYSAYALLYDINQCVFFMGPPKYWLSKEGFVKVGDSIGFSLYKCPYSKKTHQINPSKIYGVPPWLVSL